MNNMCLFFFAALTAKQNEQAQVQRRQSVVEQARKVFEHAAQPLKNANAYHKNIVRWTILAPKSNSFPQTTFMQ